MSDQFSQWVRVKADFCWTRAVRQAGSVEGLDGSVTPQEPLRRRLTGTETAACIANTERLKLI